MFSGMFHPITSSSLSLVPSGPGIGIVTVGGDGFLQYGVWP